MNRFACTLAVLLFGAFPLITRGAAVDILTLTPTGANTLFTVTGTFPGGFPVTPYSAPNRPYVLTFTVPTAPTSFAVNLPIGVFVLDTPVTLNGIVYPNSEAAFFTTDLGGGVDVCVNDICSPDPSSISPRFVIFTVPIQIFTGTLDHPVFISGPVRVDQTQTLIEAPVPEPSSLRYMILAGGILGMALIRKGTWFQRVVQFGVHGRQIVE